MPVFGLLFFVSSPGLAQRDSVYTAAYLARSSSFAATTLGFDFLTLGGGRTQWVRQGDNREAMFAPTVVPRLTIGGLHFWGHADFYVTFPLAGLAVSNTPSGLESLAYRPGIETGARFYPWALRVNAIRPFAGINRRLFRFSQVVEGEESSQYERMISPVQLGITYRTTRYLLTVSAYYQRLQDFRYFVSEHETRALAVRPWSIQAGFCWYWDTDRGYRTPRVRAQVNRKHEILKTENRLSAWYWGIGPSSVLQMSRSPFIDENFPAHGDDFRKGFTPDITFGRHFDRLDMNIGVSYRTWATRSRAYETVIRTRRHSFMLEAYKNLFNYLGFVPFVGVTGSWEELTTVVNDSPYRTGKPAVGLIFGWDIRLTKTETSLLRTNLRYVPGLHMNVNGDRMMFDQLEFNFIQYVTYIGRKGIYKKYRAPKPQ